MSAEVENRKNHQNLEKYNKILNITDAILGIMFKDKLCLAAAARRIDQPKSTVQRYMNYRSKHDPDFAKQIKIYKEARKKEQAESGKRKAVEAQRKKRAQNKTAVKINSKENYIPNSAKAKLFKKPPVLRADGFRRWTRTRRDKMPVSIGPIQIKMT